MFFNVAPLSKYRATSPTPISLRLAKSGIKANSLHSGSLFSVEQPSSVSAAKVATSVAASGSLVGRARVGRGYGEKPARIRADNEPGPPGTGRPDAFARGLERLRLAYEWGVAVTFPACSPVSIYS